MNNTEPSFFDVIVVGAGLSGIGAAYHLQNECPDKTFTVLEGRASMGGTWDLFKYPGIRSDSDMYTLGFPFSPWENPKAIAEVPRFCNTSKTRQKNSALTKRFNTIINHRHPCKNKSADDNLRQQTCPVKFPFCDGY